MDSSITTYDKHNKIWSTPLELPVHNFEYHSMGRIIHGQMKMHPNNVIVVSK